VSTILKAAQELERRARGTDASIDAVPEARRDRSRLWMIAVALGALTTAAAFALPRRAVPPPTGAPPRVDMAATAPAPTAMPPAALEREPPPVDDEAPWARVDASTLTAVPRIDNAAAATDRTARTTSPREAWTTAGTRAARPAPQPKRRGDDEDVAPAPSPEVSGVELRAIRYAPDAAERSVSLRISGGPSVRLHQGESLQGVDVQLILPDAVYLRRAGSIFVVNLRR
jgi:hypothetical protein